MKKFLNFLHNSAEQVAGRKGSRQRATGVSDVSTDGNEFLAESGKQPLLVTSLLTIFVLIALLLHLYNIGFPCLNSDEAAFGYNTFSLLKTGKDEYGIPLPLRLKSFGEYKLPAMAYLSLPFVATLGLNEISTRMVVYLVGILSPLLFYFLVKELTNRRSIALTAAFLSAFSPWIQITSRHAHEAVLAYAFLTLAFLYFVKFTKILKTKPLILFSLFQGLALFSHHISKLFVPFFLAWFICRISFSHPRESDALSESKYESLSKVKYDSDLLKQEIPDRVGNDKIKFSLIFLLPLIFFAITELATPSSRIANLLFYKTSGFIASIEELRKEHNVQLIHNKATKTILQLSNQYLSYFSPEFLVTHGDQNERFGFKGISPLTPIEFVFIFIGLYYLFKNKQEYRFAILALLLISPISASLSWQEYSLTRAFYMIVPLIIIISYGVVNFTLSLKEMIHMDATWVLPRSRQMNHRLIGYAVIGTIGFLYFFFLFFTWEYYFFHYQHKPQALSAWQCGYKEMGDYIKKHYDTTDTFYITNKLGQPYIFTLFYLQYPPDKYQQNAHLSAPDEYGFGQVDQFDKFHFQFASPKPKEKAAYIGYPEDFQGTSIKESDIQKIQISGKDIFWMYNN